ncbi:hypothetical protein EDB89DRAFT_1910393 [Lactarius sanguifluus]|nr:hypothetical protein EDB89DRAFT_1910393 [Lactarius sanguifluus]
MSSDGGSTATVETVSPGPITLLQYATLVPDLDDEISLLYTCLVALRPADRSDRAPPRSWIGFEPWRAIGLHRAETPTCGPPLNTHGTRGGNVGRESPYRRERKNIDPTGFEYVLLQDKAAFRSRSGDTGSVLWEREPSSVTHFDGRGAPLHHVLDFSVSSYNLWSYSSLSDTSKSDAYSTMGAQPDVRPRTRARSAGTKSAADFLFPSGTRLVALALSPLVRKYTATDIPALVPLLRKNLLSASSTVILTALDGLAAPGQRARP